MGILKVGVGALKERTGGFLARVFLLSGDGTGCPCQKGENRKSNRSYNTKTVTT